MLLGKKGIRIGLETVLYLIIGLMVLGVIVMFLLSFMPATSERASNWVCKISVSISSGLFGFLEKLNLDATFCYTDIIESETKEKDEVLDEIAERKRMCWNKWGEGEMNPKGKNVFKFREVECVTCDKLSFPEFEEEITIKDIHDYLRTKRKKKIGKLTYWNYFKKNNPNNVVGVILPSLEEYCRGENCAVIDKNTELGVVYLENIGPNKFGRILAYSSSGAAIGAGMCIFAGPAIPICAAAGIVVGGGVAGLTLAGQWVWDELSGRSTADGIMVWDYDIASRYCTTVTRVESRLGDKNEQKG